MTDNRYIYHITINTGHARKTPRSEINPNLTALLRGYINDMLAGRLLGVVDDKYACRIGEHNGKMCEFVIARVEDDLTQTDIIRFTVCRHSRKKARAWELVGGTGTPPEAPFCAAQILNAATIPDDLAYMPIFGDFERCIAWVWLDMIMEGAK